MMKNGFIFSLLLLVLFNTHAQKTISAYKITSTPVIDGIIDNIYLASPDSATNFIQLEPEKGLIATQKTVVYFAYDSLYIYVAFKCYQDPADIVAKIQTRDVLSKSDDNVLLLIDTYNDNRKAYGFLLNPLGSQTDFIITDDGRNFDVNWDTEWEGVAIIDDDGWTAEYAIPFKSIKYKKGSTDWGINFGRIIRNNFETVYWSGEMTQDFRISESGLLTGVNTPTRKMGLVF